MLSDLELVEGLIGRKPKSNFEVVRRNVLGVPVVIKNAPFEHDGTPMPTLYWLLPSSKAAIAIGRLESGGGVRRAEAELDPACVQAAHDFYASERNGAIAPDHVGPRPSGGVGGTRVGLKCLHAHYAHFLATGNDCVGEWVQLQLTPDELD